MDFLSSWTASTSGSDSSSENVMNSCRPSLITLDFITLDSTLSPSSSISTYTNCSFVQRSNEKAICKLIANCFPPKVQPRSEWTLTTINEAILRLEFVRLQSILSTEEGNQSHLPPDQALSR